MRFYLSTIFIIMLFNKLAAQDTLLVPRHFYIYAKAESKSNGYQSDYGRYNAKNNKLVTAQKFTDVRSMIDSLADRPCKGIIFYIHGFQADNRQFESTTSKFLHDQVFEDINDQYDVIVSLKWTSGVEYPTSILTATNKGRWFMSAVDSIMTAVQSVNANARLAFICHSMGNRVFEGISLSLKDHNKTWPITKLLMYAPDIPWNVFYDTMAHIPPMVQSAYIFYNIDDRTLSVANIMKKYNRLGIYGHENPAALPPNIHMVNTTGLRDNEGVTAQFTLHRYFYTSPTMRKQMKALLLEP